MYVINLILKKRIIKFNLCFIYFFLQESMEMYFKESKFLGKEIKIKFKCCLQFEQNKIKK